MKVYYGWWIAGALAITETISWGILYYAFSVFIVPLETDFAWTRAELTGAFSFSLLMSVLVTIPVGIWLDRHGARFLMSLASVLAVLVLLALAVVQNLFDFYLLWGCLGFLQAALLYDSAFVVLAVWFKKQRGLAMAIVTFSAGFASTIFIPLTDWLIRDYHWRTAFIVLALIQALTLPLHAFFLRRRPSDLGLAVDGEPQAAQEIETPTLALIPLKKLLRQGTFWRLNLSFALITLAAIAIRQHFIPYLMEADFDASQAAWFAGLIGAMQVVGRVIFAPLERRFSSQMLAVLIFFLQGIALVLLFGTSSNLIFGFTVLFGAAHGAATLARPILLGELYGARQYGQINSLLAITSKLAVTIAPIGAGLIYTIFGSYELLLILLIGISLFSAWMMYKLVPHTLTQA